MLCYCLNHNHLVTRVTSIIYPMYFVDMWMLEKKIRYSLPCTWSPLTSIRVGRILLFIASKSDSSSVSEQFLGRGAYSICSIHTAGDNVIFVDLTIVSSTPDDV